MNAIPQTGATRYDFTRPIPVDAAPWRIQARDANRRVIQDEDAGAGFALEMALQTLTAARWVVSAWIAQRHIRAYRGDTLPVTRMDFRWTVGRWTVQKWLAGWTASTQPNYTEVKPAGWEAAEAVRWLQAHRPQDDAQIEGWRYETVGAHFIRAWYGPRLPVRTKAQIIRMRDALKDYRNSELLYVQREPWRVLPRPAWLPADVSVMEIERDKLDLAYLL
jgi:hypothetical protein